MNTANDSLEALARVLPWDRVVAQMGEDITQYRCEDVVQASLVPASASEPTMNNRVAAELVSEMQMTVNSIMTFMFTCQNATVPISIIQTYKDASKAFQEGLTMSVSGQNQVLSNVRTFREAIAQLTSAAKTCSRTKTVYQQAAAWVNYIISFATIHSVTTYTIWIARKFHGAAHNYNATLQWISTLVYEGCRVAGMTEAWARWMLAIVSWGVYTVGPNGVVSKSRTADVYVALFATQVRGRFMHVVSKIILAMVQFAANKAVSCSRVGLAVYGAVARAAGLSTLDRMMFVLFVVSISIAAGRRIVRARHVIASRVRAQLPIPSSPAQLAAQVAAFVNDLAITKRAVNAIKRKRPIARPVNLPTAIKRANRVVKQKTSPTRYYNAQNMGSNTNNNNTQYFNAVNLEAQNLANVAERFGRLTLH